MPRGIRQPDVIAHRGASGHAPENTLAAYDLALRQGADVLEVDVRATADGHIVTAHDATLLRTADDPRRVDELTGAAVARLAHPARPVPLDVVLERYGHRTRLLIDLKEPRPAWEGRVAEAIARRNVADRVVVQSFDSTALVRLHEAAPWLTLATLYRRVESFLIDLDAVPAFAEGIGPWHVGVDAALVDAAHERGLAVRPWTVNDAAEAQRLLELGVDALITNVPDVAYAATRGADLAAA